MKEQDEYQGIRVTFTGNLGNARIPVQIDIGFGDAVTPEALPAEYPTMLEMPGPKLLAYPMETSIAEKFEAMVKRGIANSRMKDLYDIFILQREFSFHGATLQRAIANTFGRRGTALPRAGAIPLILTEDISRDSAKQKQWKAFVNKNKAYIQPIELDNVVNTLKEFLIPVLNAIANGTTMSMKWRPAGPWQDLFME
jgi:predicted nucleotidyltransferase component of viral defense system